MEKRIKKIEIKVLKDFTPFDQPKRFKIAYGGRAGGRSWTIARKLLRRSMEKKILILCAREFQSSIADSVHRLLSDQIQMLQLHEFFAIKKADIECLSTGSQFIFKGLRHNSQEIKSTEGIDICWVEEAENVSKESWDYLVPTIRKEGSEIWISFNPDTEESETYKRFVKGFNPDSMVKVYTTYQDNIFLSDTIRAEIERDKKNDYDKYEWVWLGRPRRVSNALVFAGKYVVDDFDPPEKEPLYFGVDWGFAQDPTVLIRCFIRGAVLYIDYEAYSVGVDIDDLPSFFDMVPGSRGWVIVADSERPDTISYLQKRGFSIVPSRKGAGSVEDGIAFLRGFDKIVIHPRCKNTITEFGLYSYKINRLTGEPMPMLEDKHNHCADALRYAIERVRRAEPRIRGVYV